MPHLISFLNEPRRTVFTGEWFQLEVDGVNVSLQVTSDELAADWTVSVRIF